MQLANPVKNLHPFLQSLHIYMFKKGFKVNSLEKIGVLGLQRLKFWYNCETTLPDTLSPSAFVGDTTSSTSLPALPLRDSNNIC